MDVPNYARRAVDILESYGDAEALVGIDGRRYSYSEVREGVLTMAAALWHHGVREGTAIGMLARNPSENLFLQLGAHLLGCRTAWVASHTPPAFRRRFLKLAEVDVFVYDANVFPELGPELAEAADPMPVFCFGPGGLGPDLTAFPHRITHVDDLPFDPAAVTARPSSLFQTGGTTGDPKLVHHGERFFRALQTLSEMYLASGQPHIRHLLVSGTWHVSSQTAAFMTLYTGGTLFLHDGLEWEPFMETIEKERITSTLLSPPLLYMLLDHPKQQETDFSSFKSLTIGGACANPSRLREGIDRFGPVMRVVYGMSESPFIAALPELVADPEHPERLASCGLPYGDIELEIRDEDGKPLPVGETGEIWIKGSLIMESYWGMPELTAETIVDGWLRTGDAGRLDEHGYLYILDRVKDMIVTGAASANIFSRPIEDVLASHPQVRGAAVIGVPHDMWGEAVHAYVMVTPGASVTPDQLKKLAVAALNEAWSPKTIEFIDAFPLTGSGKVDKKALRELYLADRSLS
ncbi:AMP-binding protein [Allorhizocola rhizosphaerae]|uniref:AMP-binding protein n=1 Tax=Allorhizocola rhizosphaerae TaxID=1872709 RepID=UPI000E3D4D6B|nr:AMP-binding protein [Allorhizocola rhizosphaerae]